MKRFITSLLSLGDEKEVVRHHRALAGGTSTLSLYTSACLRCGLAIGAVKLKYHRLKPVAVLANLDLVRHTHHCLNK